MNRGRGRGRHGSRKRPRNENGRNGEGFFKRKKPEKLNPISAEESASRKKESRLVSALQEAEQIIQGADTTSHNEGIDVGLTLFRTNGPQLKGILKHRLPSQFHHFKYRSNFIDHLSPNLSPKNSKSEN